MNDDLAARLAKLLSLQAEIELNAKKSKMWPQEAAPVEPPKASRFSRMRAFVSRYAVAIIMCTALGVAILGTVRVCQISDEACRAAVTAAAIGATIGVLVGALGGR